ncbi:putative homeobox-leucine zipper protein ATHB-12-like [Capsicum annuum]|nr:putative homeobox-leucine zipper protein ATHB-12-like [Capsicum annuum]
MQRGDIALPPRMGPRNWRDMPISRTLSGIGQLGIWPSPRCANIVEGHWKSTNADVHASTSLPYGLFITQIVLYYSIDLSNYTPFSIVEVIATYDSKTFANMVFVLVEINGVRRILPTQKLNFLREINPSIPEEIIFEIVSWLPAKSLMHFKCDARFCNSIASESDFVDIHRCRSMTRPGGTKFLLHGIGVYCSGEERKYDKNNVSTLHIESFNELYHHCRFNCDNYINGVICMIANHNGLAIAAFDVKPEKFKIIALWNASPWKYNYELIDVKGKLEVVDYAEGVIGYFDLWILEQTQKRECGGYIIPFPSIWKDIQYSIRPSFASHDGEIVVVMNLRSGALCCVCYDITRKSWRELEIKGLPKELSIEGIFSYVESVIPFGSLISPKIGEFSSLTHLYMSGSGFTVNDILPESVFHLPNLESLILSSNPQLTVRFPSTKWNSGASLVNLYLDGVNATGNIPESFSHLTSLLDLKISSSNLPGPIPLWNLTNIEYLDLGNNHLEGPISQFLRFENIWELSLGNNKHIWPT